MSSNVSMTLNPLFLRHDLMIELGRLDMALGQARAQAAADAVDQLEARRAKLDEALTRMSA